MFISFILIIIGVAFLLKNLGVLSGGVWGIIWPLGVIFTGVCLVVKSRKRRPLWERIGKRFGRRGEVPKE